MSADPARQAERTAAARLVRRMVTDPAARREVLEALGLAPYSDPRAAGYQALARAIAEASEPAAHS
ncbi:hypothetical protein [Pseudofrankia sp. BMG5.37]|uniref:hypothetical protein n=1 Tax=Pseudofrankia sp. BMG5.37 TaxID=3050035 RepID=UPI0028953958|nr:hypothetical protein [Pseudofrankia sp. BMG5.37]MDT3441302.1 hypothetical protein [Pseudofrankia sp. BMG5.37]